MRRRLLISAIIGLGSGMLCWTLMSHLHLGAADFNDPLREARDLLAGHNPYRDLRAQSSYPLTAAIFGLPLLWVKREVAAGLFFGISSGLLAFTLTRHGYARLLIFLAYPYWAAMLTVQWAPLLMAGALLPWLLPVTAAKPQMGAPVFLAYFSKRGLIGCFVLLAITLVLLPTWPVEWMRTLGPAGLRFEGYFVPLLALPGPALLLALWRREDPDSHLLLLCSAAPQHWFYDTFVLWLIPQSRQEILATVFLSWGAGLTRWYLTPHSWTEVGAWAVLWIYLPMLAVLLLRGTEASRRERERSLAVTAGP